MSNSICKSCHKALNGINGRYCKALNRYVEYCKEPPCQAIIKPR